MALSVKKVEMWQKDVTHKAGSLAGVLAPLADIGADLQVVMGYGTAGGKSAVVSLFPVKGKKSLSVAESAKLKSSKSVLLVQGDNKAGLGNSIAQALAGAGINIAFLSAMAMGKKFVAAFGFGSEEDTEKATALIKKAATAKKAAAKPAAKPAAKTAAKTGAKSAAKPAAKTPAKTTAKPAAKAVAKPSAKSVASRALSVGTLIKDTVIGGALPKKPKRK